MSGREFPTLLGLVLCIAWLVRNNRKANLSLIDRLCFDGQVTGLSVSGGPDQLLCVHLTGGNDFVLCLQSRRDPAADLTGEAVGTMVRLFQT